MIATWIEFARPEAFLLAVPVVLFLRGAFAVRPWTVAALRALCLTLALALLAQPHAVQADAGRDLVLLIDRSDSVGADALERARELFERAREEAAPDDRIAVVSFAGEAVVERPPTPAADGALPGTEPIPESALRPERSDFRSALDRALALIPPGRRGSVLWITDGESTGRIPLPAVRAARQRGIRLDAVMVRRPPVSDLAVEAVDLPSEVAVGEPFRISVWVRSDAAVEAPVRVRSGDRVVFEGTRALEPGRNRLTFADLHAEAGIWPYSVEVGRAARADASGLAEDRVPENNRALATVRVSGPPRVLLVSPRGRSGRLADALARNGVRVSVVAPAEAPGSLDGLDGFRVVVLENVPAEDLPGGALGALRSWVEDYGGGLLMTGGRSSFGIGGYRASVLEAVLPVSLEVRQEQRRFGLAMAIALDRSGSMSVPVSGGGTKMDLANLGAAAAIELLGPIDAVSVVAVDSSPHVVVPMQDVTDRQAILDDVRRIESMGGGIFVGVALDRMAVELAKAEQSTKHMVLFADAADAEEPGEYEAFVPKLRTAGITVSVIGLGSKSDADAQLLREIAALGGGRATFVADVADLPRVFAQETLQVARSSFVDEPVAVSVEAGIVGLSDLRLEAFPDVGGYSIAYQRPGASVALRTVDDVGAPLLSFWQAGLGRSAAFLAEVDGRSTGALGSWDRYADLFATLNRWLAGSRADDQVWTELRREGQDAVLTVELAEGAEQLLGGLRAVARAGDRDPKELYLQRVDRNRLEARFPLDEDVLHRVAVQVDADRVAVPAPVVLPYSPEFEPRRDPRGGERNLEQMVERGGGRLDPPEAELLEGPRTERGLASLGPLFAWMLLVLFLLEIAVRRLELRLPRLVPSAVSRSGGPRRSPSGAADRAADVPRGASSPGNAEGRPGAASDGVAEPGSGSASGRAPDGAAPQDGGGSRLGDLLERARRRAGRR